MIRTPNDERPIRAMPKTTQQKDDKSVPNDFRFAYSAATQWDIHIIPEPCRQRDVPPAPKLGNVAAEIRNVEVPH